MTWSVTSGAGRFAGRPASRTDTDRIGEMAFLPTALGTSTVTADVAGTRIFEDRINGAKGTLTTHGDPTAMDRSGSRS